jgi:hypothetical protein
MKRVDDIMGLWPSMADLGRDLGLPYPTVAAWKQRGSIPVAYWRDLVGAAHRRGFREVDAEMLITVHEQAAPKRPSGGFAEDAPPVESGRDRPPGNGDGSGQFSRWKPLRRTHFASTEEIVDHVRALREEWDRR